MRLSVRSLAFLIGGLILSHTFILPATLASAADSLDQAVDTTVQMNREAAHSQAKIDKLSEEARHLLEEYRLVTRQMDTLRAYNQQLERLIASQQEEQNSLERQISDIEITQREIVPLMLRMLDTLGTFVALDIPFLPKERRQRVDNLRALMDRADITVSEKYRRVLEAYQIENDYGRTIEAYTGELVHDSGKRTVHFLRLGRVMLYYQTLDDKESGYWDRDAQAWQRLPDRYRLAIQQGLRIARKQMAPDLLELPIPAPEERS